MDTRAKQLTDKELRAKMESLKEHKAIQMFRSSPKDYYRWKFGLPKSK